MADPLPTADTDLCADLQGGVDYLESCPSDPLADQEYYYLSNSSGFEFALWADLETGDLWAVCGNGTSDEVSDVAAARTLCGV